MQAPEEYFYLDFNWPLNAEIFLLLITLQNIFRIMGNEYILGAILDHCILPYSFTYHLSISFSNDQELLLEGS